MIKSMTGFGSGSSRSSQGVVTAEIKTVNHKFLEISCKFPNSIAIFEDKIKAILQKSIKRGKVYFNLIYEGVSPHADSLFVDRKLARSYYNKLSLIRNLFRIDEKIRLSDLVSLPGVLSYKALEKDVSRLWPAVHAATNKAIEGLIAEREKEGKGLSGDFRKRVTKIKEYIAKIKARSRIDVRNYKKKMEEKIREITKNKDIGTGRLELEVALYAKNSDISEEITRLKNHVANFEKIIDRDSETGKKLDFVAQELHREINTVGSKSSDYMISKSVIEVKSEIEKIREQLKNIE